MLSYVNDELFLAWFPTHLHDKQGECFLFLILDYSEKRALYAICWQTNSCNYCICVSAGVYNCGNCNLCLCGWLCV